MCLVTWECPKQPNPIALALAWGEIKHFAIFLQGFVVYGTLMTSNTAPKAQMNRDSQHEILRRWLGEHAGIFYKLVRIYAFNRHDQEDLFQEIVLQIWQSIPKFNSTAKESTYVYQVALFAAMAWSRKETRQTDRVETSTELTGGQVFKPEPVKDPRLDWLYEQISRMKVVDRSLMLLLLDGYSYREIATLMGLSESNVGSRLSRLKKTLSTANFEEDDT